MTLEQRIADIIHAGVQLWADDGELCFRAPRGTLGPAARRDLERHKPEILALLGKTRYAAPTFAQQALWFLHRLEPDRADYNIAAFFRLRGFLDAGALAAAVAEIVCRHATLRTRFRSLAGRPIQVILPAGSPELGPATLRPVDLRRLPPADREFEARRLVREELRRPFDLDAGPLLRTTWVQVRASQHLLLLTLHHIATDGWSRAVLQRELSALYRAFVAGRASPLPELEVQYADYASWQRRHLSHEYLEKSIAYWRGQLGDRPSRLELPADRRRHGQPRQARWSPGRDFRLSPILGSSLRTLGLRHEASPFMTLLASLLALLHRYTSQRDVVIGCPVSLRPREPLERLIGLFVNTLVLRSDLSETSDRRPTGRDAPVGLGVEFAELLRRVRDTTLEAYAHQDLPFERLVRELAPKREPGRNPLFQVALVLQNYPPSELELPGIEVSPLEPDRHPVRVDLTLHLWETPGGGLRGRWIHDTELFEAATIARLSRHFEILASSIAADPERPIGDLPLLAPSEIQQLLIEWNDGRLEVGEHRCLHELFEAQAERTPDAVAVESRAADGFEQVLTYGELDRRACRLARRLVALGVGPEVSVGVCLERRPEMVVAVLAVLRAGGAYVPLDANDPPRRRARLLRDSRARALLIGGAGGGDRPDAASGLRVKVAGADPVAGVGRRPPGDAVPGNAAYVLYTSGSTGRPKGVVVEHRQIVGYLRALSARVGYGPGVSFAMAQPLTADSSNTALYPPLLNGGRLCLVSEADASDPQALARILQDRRVDGLKIAPTHLGALETSLGSRLRPRRWLVVGGEASRLDWGRAVLAERRSAADRSCQVFNHYGPTEATVGTHVYRVDEHLDRHAPVTLPIGRPLDNARAYLTDRRLRPVPAGAAGELLLGGACLARGYLDQPRRTAMNFLPDLLGREPGERLYKTGDMARQLPDGTLEFLGRRDHQVKVRGFRIEPREVEAALVRHPEVSECLALACSQPGGGSRLTAFVVPARPPGPSSVELQKFLRDRLPRRMIPSAFEPLEALPRTPHGKVDRAALERRLASTPEPTGAFVAPRNAVERMLAQIWARILKLERVGVHDDYFELGGDSILSILIVAEGRRRGLRLKPHDLFRHPTVAELAEVAEEAVPARPGLARPDPGPITGPVPLTPIQREFFDRCLPQPWHFNQAVMLELREPLSAALVERAVARLYRHHDALRLRFEQRGSEWRQLNAGVGDQVSWSRVDLSQLAEPRLRSALEDTAGQLQASLDLAGPVVRAVLFDLGSRGSRLLVVIHHLAVDAVSWRILLEDLETILSQLRAGRAVALPAKTTSFKRWAEALAACADTPEGARELAYWLALPRRSPGLPVDHPGRSNTVASADTVEVTLASEATRRLLREVPAAEGPRIHEVLLTALALALARWTGGGPLLVEVEGHGRQELSPGVDLSRTVGWFTATFPIAVDVEAAGQPGRALQSVTERLRGVPRGGIGFGLLRYLGPPPAVRQLSSVPRPEVRFNYLGRLDARSTVPALLRPADEPSGQSRSPQGLRRHLLRLDASVMDGRLRMECNYSRNLHRRATIEKLSGSLLEELRALIAHCLSPEAIGPTPTDFHSAGLDRRTRPTAGDPGVEDVYPLSPMQRSMLRHGLSAPSSTAYRLQLAWSLRGELDVEAFRSSWQRVLDRHPALRTDFVWEGVERPLQIVRRSVALPWEEHDWRGAPCGDSARERFERLLQADRARGFELSRAPLMRVVLVRLADDLHRCLWSRHHLIQDGWSRSLLLDEVFADYRASRRGEKPGRRRSRPFGDYIKWLKAQNRGPAADFWRRTLAGFESAAPISIGDAGLEKAEPRHRELRLGLEPTASLRGFARRHRLTLGTLVQAAWAELLSRLNGASDIVFGTTVAGRPGALLGADEMIGLFINVLPLRIRAPGREPVVGWLRQLQDRLLEMQRYAHCSLAEIRRWAGLEHDRPLFETAVVFENYPRTRPGQLGRLRLEDFWAFDETAYPLTLWAIPGRELRLRVSYDPSRFERAAVRGMLARLEAILEDMTAEPGRQTAPLETHLGSRKVS